MISIEAERKACEDEGNETIKRNQQQLNRLKQDGITALEKYKIKTFFFHFKRKTRIVDFRSDLTFVTFNFLSLFFSSSTIVGDIKMELSDQVRNSRQNHPMNSSQMGILQLLKENNIDYGKYKLTKSAQEILDDLDWRVADIVKQADLTKHQIQTVCTRLESTIPPLFRFRLSKSLSQATATTD